MNESTNVTRVREARAALDKAEAMYRAAVVRALIQRGHKETAARIAEAAGVSRARVYQIAREEEDRVS